MSKVATKERTVEGFERFETLFNKSQETLVPVKPYENDVLDLFEDFKPISDGGEGSVIKARRKSDGITVALKKYHRGKIKNIDDWKNSEIGAGRERSFLERALRDEVANVPTILDFGTTGVLAEPVVAMEYIEGKTLDDIINDSGFIHNINTAIKLAKEVSKPLKYAHEDLMGFVHRDIKPANIMIDNVGDVVVLDWSTLRDRGITLKNTQLYSPNYTAPEVLEGKSVTPAADIYSLGKTLEHYFLGSLFKERKGEINRNNFNGKNIPDYIIDALMKATQTNPNNRYQSIDDFVKDLENKVGEVNGTMIDPNPENNELTDFEKKTIREVARNEYIEICKFFGGILVAGIVGTSVGFLTLHSRKNPESVKYVETETGFTIKTGEKLFEYKFTNGETCSLKGLGVNFNVYDSDCDGKVTDEIVGNSIEEQGRKDSWGEELNKFYDIHEVLKKIESWKIKHLYDGVLAGDEIVVLPTGFIDRSRPDYITYDNPSNICTLTMTPRGIIYDNECDALSDNGAADWEDLDRVKERRGIENKLLKNRYTDRKIPEKVRAWKAIKHSGRK